MVSYGSCCFDILHLWRVYSDLFFAVPLVELAMPWPYRVPRKNVVFGYAVVVCFHG